MRIELRDMMVYEEFYDMAMFFKPWEVGYEIVS
jgi:hypothetical protein